MQTRLVSTQEVFPRAEVRSQSLEERLERGEVYYYPSCPFPLPEGEDREFLLAQRLGSRAHKNVSFDPATGRAAGFARQDEKQAERLREMLSTFSREVTAWLATTLPRYAGAWRLDKVSYRPEEEATRRLRQKARNDLLHVDAFPSRPTRGHRILRVFANVNPKEPRVWVTSDPFGRLLERFGRAAGLPGRQAASTWRRVGQGMLGILRPGRRRSEYDAFMLRFHDYLKANEEFQERGPKRLWSFPPNSAWLALTDTCSHAVLRGRFALEHSYFIPPSALALPDEAPASLLARTCGCPVLGKAA
jgi:hypothetical protein